MSPSPGNGAARGGRAAGNGRRRDGNAVWTHADSGIDVVGSLWQPKFNTSCSDDAGFNLNVKAFFPSNVLTLN